MNINLSIDLFIVIGLIVIGLVIVLYSQFKKEKIRPNYRLFFILGMTWVPLGVVFYTTTRNIGFLIIGLINKDKWGETVIANPQKRKLLVGLMLTVLLVLATFLWKYFK